MAGLRRRRGQLATHALEVVANLAYSHDAADIANQGLTMTPFYFWRREAQGWVSLYFDVDAAPSPSDSRPAQKTGQPVDPRIARAGDVLLKHGGHSLGFLPSYETAERLVARGRLFPGPRRRLEKVPPNLCHVTATLRYKSDPTKLRLVVGCVLTGGLWTYHTWTMEGDVIVDPLADEEAFYGYFLNAEETAFYVADVERQLSENPDLSKRVREMK